VSAEVAELVSGTGSQWAGKPGERPWRRQVLELARVLQRRGHIDLSADGIADLVMGWHRQLRGESGPCTRVFEELGRVWGRLRNVDGRGLADILDGVDEDTEPLPWRARRFAGNPHYERLIRCLRRLGRYNHGGKFPCSVTQAKEYAGLKDRNQANVMLSALEIAGVIRCVDQAGFVPGTERRRARTWIYQEEQEEVCPELGHRNQTRSQTGCG
jgi:hypothetical protein